MSHTKVLLRSRVKHIERSRTILNDVRRRRRPSDSSSRAPVERKFSTCIRGTPYTYAVVYTSRVKVAANASHYIHAIYSQLLHDYTQYGIYTCTRIYIERFCQRYIHIFETSRFLSLFCGNKPISSSSRSRIRFLLIEKPFSTSHRVQRPYPEKPEDDHHHHHHRSPTRHCAFTHHHCTRLPRVSSRRCIARCSRETGREP